MTDTNEIIRMAREAGFAEGVAEIVGLEGFERFFNLAFEVGAAEEREACAKVCDAEGREWDSDDQISEKNYAAYCAAAIRARGDNEEQ